MKSQEFNLSKEREVIRKYLIDIGLSLEESRKVWELIIIQDEEFIRLLKEYPTCHNLKEQLCLVIPIDELNKIFGDKLNGN